MVKKEIAHLNENVLHLIFFFLPSCTGSYFLKLMSKLIQNEDKWIFKHETEQIKLQTYKTKEREEKEKL